MSHVNPKVKHSKTQCKSRLLLIFVIDLIWAYSTVSLPYIFWPLINPVPIISSVFFIAKDPELLGGGGPRQEVRQQQHGGHRRGGHTPHPRLTLHHHVHLRYTLLDTIHLMTLMPSSTYVTKFSTISLHLTKLYVT